MQLPEPTKFHRDLSVAFTTIFARLYPHLIGDDRYEEHLTKTEVFLKYITKHMQLSVYEYLYGLFIFDEYVQNEEDREGDGKDPLICETNFATIIVCGLLIANKLCRDVPYNNKYWITQLNLPKDAVNKSEVIVLTALDYRLQFREIELRHLYEKYFLKIQFIS